MEQPAIPDWLVRAERLIPVTARLTYERSFERGSTPDLNAIAACAALHFAHSLEISVDANRQGRHAAAVAMLRQCVESLTIVELALLPASVGDDLLQDWKDGKSQGTIRRLLESRVWQSYGPGLWNQPWAAHFRELAKAVQPYAHYSPELQAWQLALPPNASATIGKDGNYLLLARIGPFTYDPSKASRVTALQAIVVWTLSRIIIENGADDRIDASDVQALGDELENSPLLGRGTLTWHQQFWAHEFDRP